MGGLLGTSEAEEWAAGWPGSRFFQAVPRGRRVAGSTKQAMSRGSRLLLGPASLSLFLPSFCPLDSGPGMGLSCFWK